MMWIGVSLLAMLFFTAQIEANRYFKCNGAQLNFWRSLWCAIILSPSLILLPLPSYWAIYAAALIDGIAGAIIPSILYSLAAAGKSRVSSLSSPLATFTAFCFWLMLHETERQLLLDRPFNFAILVGGFVLLVLGLNKLRRNDASLHTLLCILPIAIFSGCMDVLVRVTLMDQTNLILTITQFCALAFAFTAIMTMVHLRITGKLFENWREYRFPGLYMAGFSTTFLLMITAAVIIAPNPAYPGFIMMLAPVVLLAWHKIRGIDDDANPTAALLVVAGALLAVFQATHK